MVVLPRCLQRRPGLLAARHCADLRIVAAVVGVRPHRVLAASDSTCSSPGRPWRQDRGRLPSRRPTVAASGRPRVNRPESGHIVQVSGCEDATALTMLSVAVAAAVVASSRSLPLSAQFVLAAAAGRPWGRRSRAKGCPGTHADPLLTNTISLATPFVAYLLGRS